MPYELDATNPDGSEEQEADEERRDAEPAAEGDQSLGIPIPADHVAAFVAEAFEDPERSTTWTEVVDAMVAPEARDAWEALSPREQAAEVLSTAADYDRTAAEKLGAIPLDAERPDVHADVQAALRCRRNADAFRNGVAAAYADGRLDDDALVSAVEDSDFDPGVIAERESALERVADVYDVQYRPYGGTLMDTDDGPDPEVDHPETW